ncbi:MAG: hypothetical protein IJ640_09355 [Prevotella sp.]|nr:hypothetical protein [Prevotella sp.]
MNWEIVATILGSLGGWEAVKFLIHRKQNYRIKEAEADSVEFSVLKEINTFMQEQLRERVQQDAEKEKRFVEQTQRLRKVQDENYALLKEKNKLELELQTFRCVVKKCPNREPQNGY